MTDYFGPRSLPGNDNGWGGYTLRVEIDKSQLSDAWELCSIVFQASSGTQLAITDAFVEITDGSMSYSRPPKRITFGGANSVVIPAGTTFASDPVAFSRSVADSVLVGIYTNDNSSYAYEEIGSGGYAEYKSGSDAGTQAGNGYSYRGNRNYINAITSAQPLPPSQYTFANQVAIVVPSDPVVPADVSAIAIVIPSVDNPAPSAGAFFNQFAIVCVDYEYDIKPQTHGFLIRQLWGFPLLIQSGV